VKRLDLIRHLTTEGCKLVREGSNHSWWGHATSGRRSAVPRHREIDRFLARKICRDLGIANLD
jgi:mRNA interferase HicA